MSAIDQPQGDYGERLARIEVTLAHMATSEELQKVKTGVQKVITEVSIIKWLLGTVAAAVLYAAAKYIVS